VPASSGEGYQFGEEEGDLQAVAGRGVSVGVRNALNYMTSAPAWQCHRSVDVDVSVSFAWQYMTNVSNWSDPVSPLAARYDPDPRATGELLGDSGRLTRASPT
jgi:hypothetical protein